MGFYLKQQSSRMDYSYREYILDKEEDLNKVPTHTCSPGSVCFVIETSNVYMLDNNQEWKKI